ncbi:HAD hydrolase-like protein [bacterium]|nr:HAD hydrolase-like protein [bacterium]
MRNNILIFDYDGVIVDSLDLAMKVFNNTCKKHKINGVADKNEFANLFDENFYKSVIKFGIPKEKINLIINDFKKYFKLYQNKIRLFKKMDIVFNQLSKNNDIFIVTSNSTETVKNYISEHNINGVKDVNGVEDGISKSKKILLIKKKYPKSKIYYVGDTKGDIAEGKEAGVKTVGVTWGYHNKEKISQAKPDFIVSLQKDLLKIFDI